MKNIYDANLESKF